MGTLKTTNIQTITGSGTLTLGTSGETLALGSGVTSNLMYPAFQVYLSSNQSISNNTTTKVQFDTEDYDTDNCYDNSTNYRFTPTVAGKYFVYLQTRFQVFSALTNIQTMIYKNGTNVSMFSGNDNFLPTLQTNKVIDMNGSTDYLEGFIYQNSGSSQNATGSDKTTFFGAYRIGT
tara:strand:- start:21 stop:548 length:528 start_codon:yes stop_codon:yes gene_type:complete